MAKFGWCTGPDGVTHAHTSCPGKLQKWIPIAPRRGVVAGIQMLDDWSECECYCHKKGKPKAKPRTRKRKK